MDDPGAVRLVDRPRHGLDESRRLAGRPGRPVEPVRQAPSRDVLHLEERLPVVVADGVDLDDVRVLEPRDHLGFGQEPRGVLRRCMGAGPDHLQRHDPIEPELPPW